MSWIGKWRNQYGSVLEITDDSNHRIIGKFRTALPDSGFYGEEVELVGVHYGDCIGLTAGGLVPSADMVVTYTCLLREVLRRMLNVASPEEIARGKSLRKRGISGGSERAVFGRTTLLGPSSEPSKHTLPEYLRNIVRIITETGLRIYKELIPMKKE